MANQQIIGEALAGGSVALSIYAYVTLGFFLINEMKRHTSNEILNICICAQCACVLII